MIDLDGGHLEGGGQILRTAIALSAVTRQAVRIFNIRKGREKSGLRPQHPGGVAAASKICNARVDGLVLNSSDIRFEPGSIKGGTYTVDTKTAGAVTLILQTLVPFGIYADSPLELVVKGGTAVPYSPTISYFQHVFCGILTMMGVSLSVTVKRHGFYPKGGGEVQVRISPSKMKSLHVMDRSAIKSITVYSFASNHLKTARVAERMMDGFAGILKGADANCSYVDALSPGCFISAVARYGNSILGSDELGKRGKRSEDVGADAAKKLRAAIDSEATLDSWMVDQVIPFMAVSTHQTGEPSKVRVSSLTKHAETNIWIVQKFLPVSFKTENNLLTCAKIS
jgi:RNA 3'-phosphate cyclase